MNEADLFRDNPAERGRDPFWILVSFFGFTILAALGFELIRVNGNSSDWFGAYWEYFYLIARNSGDLAFVGLFVLVIWFGRNRNWVFAVVLMIALINWLENELVSLAFFGGFHRTIDWWELEMIDASATVTAAIVVMPLVKWMTRSKQILTRSISIADIMLLTLAIGVLISSTSHIANLKSGEGALAIYYVGPSRTAFHVMASILLSMIGLTVVYVSYFGRLLTGVAVYLLVWIVYMSAVNLVEFSRLLPSIKTEKLTFQSILHGDYDHFVPVFTWFLLCMFLARLGSRFAESMRLKRIDASGSENLKNSD